jgi:hypothetical protein
MNGQAHINIMVGAVDALPQAMRQKLEPVRGLLQTVGNYPDFFDDPARPAQEKARIDPEWERFCRFPASMDGPCLHRWPHPKTRQDLWRPMITYWMQQAIDCVRQDDLEGFIKFMGCLSHMEGDITQPAHLMDLALLEELVPAPAAMKGFHYHTDLEAVTGECGTLRAPRLLGTDVEEAGWRLGAIHLEDMAQCRRYIVPILQALFSGDEAEAVRLSEPPVTRAAQNTADLLYTALCLAGGKVSDAERRALAAVDLRHWRPDAEAHDSVYGGAILDGNRSTPPSGAPIIPAQLRDAQGQVRSARGLGMLPHSGMNGPREAWLRYSLPRGTFARFESVCGMHAGLTREGAVEFIVELDDRPVFHSGRRTGTDPALPVSIALKEAGQLTIKVVDANDEKTFWNNHAFWGEPRLVKDTLAPETSE